MQSVATWSGASHRAHHARTQYSAWRTGHGSYESLPRCVYAIVNPSLSPVTASPEQAVEAGLLERYQALLLPEEAAELATAATPELWRERLLARTLTRTVLGRYCHPVCG